MINKSNIAKYCSEDISLIENYEKAVSDLTKMWECHHKGEILPCGRFSREDLKKFGLYWNRPANELVMFPKAVHRQMHMTGRYVSAQTRKRMSKANLGKKLSAKHKQRISKTMRGIHRSEETRKKMSNAKCGMKFWNNGVKCIRAKRRPKGFKAGIIRKGN